MCQCGFVVFCFSLDLFTQQSLHEYGDWYFSLEGGINNNNKSNLRGFKTSYSTPTHKTTEKTHIFVFGHFTQNLIVIATVLLVAGHCDFVK